jgi:predicted dehydrogenase
VHELEFPAPYALRSPTDYRHTRGDEHAWTTTAHRSWQEAYERQLVHFYACVAEGAPCRVPAEDGLADVRLIGELLAARGVEVAA